METHCQQLSGYMISWQLWVLHQDDEDAVLQPWQYLVQTQ